MKKLEKLKKELAKDCRLNEPMSKYTSLRIGGPAALLVDADTEENLIHYIKLAQRLEVEYFLLGGGSNLLVSDDGFKGLVIRNKMRGIKVKGKVVWVKTGTKLQDLVDFLCENGLAGMEKIAGIPGTVGGAIYGNSGAYGQTASDCLVRVKVFDKQRMRWIPETRCGFAYRDSLFKKNGFVLLEAEFEFKKTPSTVLKKQAVEVIRMRRKKYRLGILCPGSYFKNVLVSDLSKQQLKKIPVDKILYGKIPAGYLLEMAGAKGAQLGRIKIADFHANLFMNLGRGKACDFYKLAMKYKQKVKEKFGINLESEVRLIGFDKKIAVLGFGLEGKDIVGFFLKEGADITIFDQKEENELDFKGIDKTKVKLVLGQNYLSAGLDKFDTIFRSPGVYRYIPQLVKAEKKGVEISSAIKLFFDLCPGRIIGVTGTKGKGTTSTLIYRILKASGKDVYLAGNIGKSYLELLAKLNKSSWVVLELSSFQLIDLLKSPHIAVVLNITADHLDWHKNRKEYLEAKTNIVGHQSKKDFAVVNDDYNSSKKFEKYTAGRKYYFAKKKKVKGCYVKNGKIILSIGSSERLIGDTEELLLRGKHNWENVMAAICASRLAGATIKAIKKTVLSFKGLEHRLESLGKAGDISFYNDSFSTNPQPTIAAIKSFKEPITLILGGSDKGFDYSEMAKELAKKRNLKTVVLIGEITSKIKKALIKAKFNGEIIELGRSGMDKIVKKSFEKTAKGGVVLLSPASASFDMFENYKDRGRQFKKRVRLLRTLH